MGFRVGFIVSMLQWLLEDDADGRCNTVDRVGPDGSCACAGAANFTTPDMDPVRHSLMDPSYLEEKPAGMGRKVA